MVKSLYAMPVIVLNMGSEMIYILNQRLQAQAIQEEKSKKVLQDVMKAMYAPLFVQELFKPQEMYSPNSTKQIFEKLAHSSIMRLNKSSMDKLYDLMNMGFKRQIIMCSCPQQYLTLTLNHLESIKRLVDDPYVHELVQTTIDNSIAMYTSLNDGQWFTLKLAMLRFLQDKRIKVSLFLQQELQTNEGALVLNLDGKLPRGTEMPGKIRYLENGIVTSTRNFDTTSGVTCAESRDVLDIRNRLGLNMYLKDGSKEVPHPSDSADSYSIALRAMSGVKGGPSSVAGPKTGGPSSRYSSVGRTAGASTAKAELSLLEDLLGFHAPQAGAKGDSKGFRINLFPGNQDDKDGDYGGVLHFDIDGTADAKSMARYMEELDLTDDYPASAKGGADDDEDDLLALMDSAK